MTSSLWSIEDKWKNKPQGQVWRVINEQGEQGFFKFAYPSQWYDAGPIVGNEWIAKKLADLLHLPCANLQIADIQDGADTLHGIVSLPRHGVHITSWNRAPTIVHADPFRYVKHFDRLLSVIVFDIWLTNIDRGSGKNIMIYEHKQHFHWYLIDHAYCAYGCDRKWKPGPWTNPYWKEAWKFYHIPKGWLRYVQLEHLLSMAKQITAIPDHTISELLHSVPDPLYTKELKKQMTAMLTSRKRDLPVLLSEWFFYNGIKESQL